MIIYNETTNVAETIHDQWLAWIQQEHIPEMMATGKFSKALLTKVLVTEEMGGITYAVQYTTDSKATLEQYYLQDAPLMQTKSKRFGGQCVTFSTELQVINELS